jgi:hypothetical protein
VKELSTLGHIEGGVLKIHNRKEFQESLGLFNDCRVMVVVKKIYRQRTTLENAYYFGYIIEVVRECIREAWGKEISKETAHFLLKENCNFDEIVLDGGEIKRIPKETHVLSTVEFEEYLERCRKWIYEYFNFMPLLPGEQTEIDL